MYLRPCIYVLATRFEAARVRLSRLETPISVLAAFVPPRGQNSNGRAPLAHESTRQRQLSTIRILLPPHSFLSFFPSLRVFSVYPCCNWEIFFFFFGNSHFSLVTWLFRNMEIWNIWKRLGKFWDWKNEGVFAHRIYIAEQ